MLDILYDLLRSPSAFQGDPVGAIGNQSAHALAVGGGLFLLYLPLCRRFFTGGAWSAWQVVLLIYAGWEAAQFWWGSTLLDAVTDWAFVATGATLAWSLWSENLVWARRLFAALVAAACALLFFT